MGGQVGGEADPKECPWPLHLAGRFPAWRPELGGTLATAAISWSPAASCQLLDERSSSPQTALWGGPPGRSV